MDTFNSAVYIGKGLFLSMQILLSSLLIGIVLGLLLAVLRHKGYMRLLINLYISIVRGTPVILQLSFFYFAVPNLLSIKLSIFASAFIALGLNSSAYIAEICRAGIESIPISQFEAAKTLRISSYLMWKDIIIPQVARNIFPAIVNETITLFKETALVTTIGGHEIMHRANEVAAESFSYFEPMCIAGLFYYIVVIGIEKLGSMFEKRLQNA